MTSTVNAPGVVVPSKLAFDAYTSKTAPPGLLLHTSEHPTVEYTAVDSNTIDSNEKHLKHYVAIYDPATNKLDVTEARKMTMKSIVRRFQQPEEREEETAPIYSSRAALTEAFGSKKSKKAVATIAENRLLAGGAKDDPLTKALLAEAPDDEDPTEESSQSSKPVPPANIEATEIKEAYPLSTLVIPQPTSATFSSLPVAHWRHRLTKKKPVSSAFRFIANRTILFGQRTVENPTNKEYELNFQLLKYIEIMLEIHRYAVGLGRHKSIPQVDKWPAKTIQENTPPNILQSITEHFFPESRVDDTCLTRIRTYILALCLHLPPGTAHSAGAGMLAVEPTDIYLDLALKTPDGAHLFKELGCKVEPAKEAELSRWGMKSLAKKQNDGSKIFGKVKFAKLTLPLEFPKVSQGRRPGRGRR